MGDTFKVAVASTDGQNVDSHFGHVDRFVIFEVDAVTGDGKETELRDVEKAACGGGACGEGDAFEKIAESLSDVEFVLAAKVGGHASQALSRKQIITLDYVGLIDEALHKVRDYRDKKRIRLKNAKKLLESYGIETEED